MKSDISRDTFDPAKHFSRVIMQQGRVQLDADWNEQADILLHYIRTLAADLIGLHGGPGDGFKIEGIEITDVPSGQKKEDFTIQKGRYYVEGIPCENEALIASSMLRGISFKDFEPLAQGTYLVYLDVWERHLTWVEDESIREVALAGSDTATRAKVVWQVKTNTNVPGTEGNDIEDLQWSAYLQQYRFQPAERGSLKARVRPEATSTNPCITSPKSSYRGAENQLYRVEVHSGSPDEDGEDITPTFKWSRENGSVVFPISKLTGAQVTVENLGRDSRLGLKVGDYVEVVDDDYTLQGRADPLLKVANIDRTAMTVTLSGAPDGSVGQAPTKHPLLRRWDADVANIVEAPSADAAWSDLEDGIQIQFQPGNSPSGNIYRSGDYWLIPARVATGNLEWPKLRDAQGNLVLDTNDQPQPVALPPHGVEHHYAPLAIIDVAPNGTISVTHDLRRIFSPVSSPAP